MKAFLPQSLAAVYDAQVAQKRQACEVISVSVDVEEFRYLADGLEHVQLLDRNARLVLIYIAAQTND